MKHIVNTIFIVGSFAVPHQVYAASMSIGYVYDDRGRLIEATWPNGSKVTYSYDDAGNRTVVTTVKI